MRMTRSIPALPVREIARAVAFYRDRLGFSAPHQDEGFAFLVRDDVEIHLWASGDEGWRKRGPALGAAPVVSGAESFLAGTASCRIETDAVDELYEELRERDVLHPVSRDGVSTTDFGTRELATLDGDGNLITFFQWTAA